MLAPELVDGQPAIFVKTFDIGRDYPINDWLKDMRLKIKVLDIQMSHNYILITYQSFTGAETEPKKDEN